MTDKPAESAVERYFIETIHHDRTRYTELNKVPGTTHCLITTADAAIAELKARIEELSKHEENTHERLGAILGTDTSLEDGARRLKQRADALDDALRFVCGPCYCGTNFKEADR